MNRNGYLAYIQAPYFKDRRLGFPAKSKNLVGKVGVHATV